MRHSLKECTAEYADCTICSKQWWIQELVVGMITLHPCPFPALPCYELKKGKGNPYSITKRRVLELIPVLGSKPAGDVSHKPGGRLPLLSARPSVKLATLKTAATNFASCSLMNRGTMGVNSLPKAVTRQHRGCDLNSGPPALESSTLTTRLPSHPMAIKWPP